jgi:hypothetical protein
VTTRLIVAVALVGLVAAGGPGTPSQGASPQSAFATVPATVLRREPIPILDKNGVVPWRVVPWTLVSGLTAEDFEILGDGAACSIDSFSADAVPLTVALLLDVSPSSQIQYDYLLVAVQETLIPALKPGDRVSISRVGSVQVGHAPFVSGDRELTAAAGAALSPPARGPSADECLRGGSVNLVFGFGPSPIWDSVDAAITSLQGESGRRAIVLVTDGRATANVHSLSEVTVRGMEAAVPVAVIGGASVETLRQSPTMAARVRPLAYVQEMADGTGGVCIELFGDEPYRPHPYDEKTMTYWLGRALVHAIEALRGSYTLGFSCGAPDGRMHALDVRVRRPGFDVRAPRAYVAKASTPHAASW